mgnify:CR=1 FL=1|jgi:hypothetical protein|tara:strand:- start:5909 stop:6652 length:744 start_codon:yes stop_codon:yes gene_type:complete
MNTQNIENNTNNENLIIKKKKIIIAIPGDNFSSKFLIAWTGLLNTLWESGKYDVTISPGISSFVTFARMQTLGLNNLKGFDQKPFDGIDFDIWITIDSDIIFTPANVIKLIESTNQHNVVSGIYRMTDLKNLATVVNWDINYFKKNGNFEYLTVEQLDEYNKNNKNNNFMKVSYTGMGFMAVTKEALYSITYPYFNSELQEIIGNDGKIIRELISEDVAFCKNLEKNGHPIHIITDLRVGHEKKLLI